ncbi:chemotaxis protein CheB [Catalinimonas sp. 4WD22]|uniref:CheR family methyltransferase n=1 Tax=Catalinimonas locisalis TaxID=3133978 RepID=UPI003101A501
MNGTPKEKKRQHIIAIGASAGGMEEIHTFFDHTPLDEVSYVIVQHLSPDFKSRMAELLAKHSKLKICEVEDEMKVEKNQVYMIPNNMYMTIREGKLRLVKKQPRDAPHMTINTFFHSLAEDVGDKAIGIILSGTGNDGSIGIESIHQAGGMVLAQDPASAKFDGMPSSAISTGFVDAVLPTEAMPSLIENYVKNLAWKLEIDALTEEEEEVPIAAILNLIQDQLPLDFSSYKRPTIMRRIKRRMVYSNFTNLNKYFTFLHDKPDELELLAKDFMIGVTQFFRDNDAFEKLEKDIIPEIVQNHNPEYGIKIWVAGCATGEEAYSLAILLSEYLHRTDQQIEVRIFATDIDRAALKHASRGVYPENIAKDISQERLQQYFVREGEGYKVKQEIRRMLIFSQHDVTKNPPYCKIDLISCRNLLIYLNPVLQKKVFSRFHFGLKVGGYLFLGASENTHVHGRDFVETDKKNKIFQKVKADRTTQFDSYIMLHEEIKTVDMPAARQARAQHNTELIENINEWVWNECGLTGVCVDENLNIVESFGDLSPYLFQKMFTFNLHELLPEQLKVAVGNAISKSMKGNEPVFIKQIPVEKEQRVFYVNLHVKPLILRRTSQKLTMLLLSEEKSEQIPETAYEVYEPEQYTRAYVEDLEEELKEMKEKLQAALDHQEATNENMQSFNEELLSANEELQSANEEQESVNEEMQTINSEHLSTIRELSLLNDDLDNYFRSNINGQLYVDNELLLKKFSPKAFELINLRDSDLGRPINNITTNIKFETLTEDIKKVISEGDIIVKEVQSTQNKWYQVTTMPYIRQANHQQDGAIITFNDITDLKRGQSELDEINKSLMKTNADLDNFVYTASHDLMSPLSSIEGLISLLLERIDTSEPENTKLSKLIFTCINKFKAVIKDLGEIGKAESEKDRIWDSIRFEELLEDLRLSMLDKVTSTNTTLLTDFKVEEIQFSRKNLRSLLYNLFSNAIKYKSPERDPEIRISTEMQQGLLALTVSDNGMGIKSDQLDSIFTLYQRLGQQVEGQGIGLYLVKKIMDASGGSVKVTSEYGKGTTFALFFKQ